MKTCEGCRHAEPRWRVFRFVLWCKRYGKVQTIGCIYHTGGSK